MRPEGGRLMHKCLFFSCQLLFGAWATCAQEPGIQGVVLDPGGRVIRGARVECAGKAAVTELDGRFKIAGVDRCQAAVSAPGFETRSVDMSAAREAEVELSIAGVTERIVVTATRHQTTIEEAGVAASILTRTDLAQRQFPMVADVLRDLPGLQVTTTGRTGGLTSVFTRGAQRTGTLFLIDGVPVNDPGGEFNLAHLTSSDMDRIEVIRGPESALFGAEAAAGVVQMFTRSGDAENVVPKGFLSYERGNFSTDDWKAGLAGGSGYRLDYSLTAGQFRTTGEFPNDDYRNTSASANLGLHFSPATQLRGVVRVEDSVVGVPGQVGYGLIDYDARETNRDSVLSLRLDDARGSHYAQQVSFGYHRMRDLYTDYLMDGPYGLAALVRDVVLPQPRTYLVRLLDPNQLPTEIPAGTRLVSQEVTLYNFDPFLSATARTRAGYQGNWGRFGSTVVFGYDYERQDGDVSGRVVARNNHGLFLHGQQTFWGRVFLSGGMRM